MWAVEGLTHRYPTKVLAEVLPTCPQYCGHCTRMDLVGNPTPVTGKHKFALAREDRLGAMLAYLRRTPGVRDVVVSGGDVANLPWPTRLANLSLFRSLTEPVWPFVRV
jgi:L-lysine 2,3-aminomutase